MSLAPSWRHFGLRWPLFGLWGALFGLSGSLADLCWGLLGSLGKPLVTLGLFFTLFCGGFLERHGESSEHLEIHPVCIYIGRPYSAMRGWESWDRETSDIDGVFPESDERRVLVVYVFRRARNVLPGVCRIAAVV